MTGELAEIYSIIQSVWTIVVMVIFIGVVAWAWSSRNKRKFEEAANLPFDDDDELKPSAEEKQLKENKNG